MALPGDLRAGGLEVALAETEEQIAAALRLRYKVFYDEMGAIPTDEMKARGQDFDKFDDHADHLLVIDHDRGEGADAVVGTYRLLRREHVAHTGRFYSADEYDLSKIEALEGNIMELGRSCVDSQYRNRATMQLLWRGIAAYVFHFDIVMMFGCASLHGTDPKELAPQLSYLYHNHLAPEELCPRALEERYAPMNLVPADQLDAKRALAKLPPLVKGYLRLGGFVGDGAVVDHQFNTTDVCVMVKTDLVSEKYYKHYDRTAREGGTD
ncbi:MAG: GNAT family N-acetyltransferase [Rhodospirillaceae bacterium]